MVAIMTLQVLSKGSRCRLQFVLLLCLLTFPLLASFFVASVHPFQRRDCTGEEKSLPSVETRTKVFLVFCELDNDKLTGI